MPKVTEHAPGTPSWADLSTSDDNGAVAFYGSLFGWTDDPQEVGLGSFYHMQRVDGQSVVGIHQQGEEEKAQNVPPHWNTYFTVDNADETAQKAKEAGGAVIMGHLTYLTLAGWPSSKIHREPSSMSGNPTSTWSRTCRRAWYHHMGGANDFRHRPGRRVLPEGIGS